MSTAEILSRLNPKTVDLLGISDGSPNPEWQDILHAMHSLDHWKISFLLYVYGDNPQCRHEFFAGLFMEIMERPDVQAWIRRSKAQSGYNKAVERMCVLAIIEWKHWNVGIFEIDRANHMGVSLSTWKRKYKLIYQTIIATPAQWESEVMRIVTKRLK